MSDSNDQDKKKSYNKKYYETHKDKWTTKYICEQCGGIYCLNSKHYHFISKKHKTTIILKEKDKEIINLKDQLQKVD